MAYIQSRELYTVRAIRLKKDVVAILTKLADDDMRTFQNLTEKILSEYAAKHSAPPNP